MISGLVNRAPFIRGVCFFSSRLPALVRVAAAQLVVVLARCGAAAVVASAQSATFV